MSSNLQVIIKILYLAFQALNYALLAHTNAVLEFRRSTKVTRNRSISSSRGDDVNTLITRHDFS